MMGVGKEPETTNWIWSFVNLQQYHLHIRRCRSRKSGQMKRTGISG